MKGEDGKMHASDDGVRAKLLAALAVMLTLGFASPGAAVTYISSCTNLNTAGETYLLTANIATSTFFCMNVTASGVTLDCQGYTISGGGVAGYAVLVDGNHDGVGVRNCRITNFSSAGGAGIAFGNGADNGHVANNTIITGHYGMYFAGINNTLASNTVSSNAVGIYVINSANGTVYNNTVTGSTDKGIYLAGSSWNNVSRNRVSGGSYGIVLNVSSFNAVSDNDASSGNYGIYIVNSPNNRLNSNNVTNANIIGVYLVSSSNNNLTDNIVAPANYYGLRVDSSSNVTLINNTVNQNYDGIYFVSSNYSNIVNNSASSNSHYGIVLTGSSYNNLTNNTASFNAAGITLGSSSNYNRLVENNASSDSLGMQISSSSHNILMSNVAQNNSGWDFYSLLNSMNNTVINLTTWQNRLSFTSLDIALKGLQPPEIPAGLPANRSAIGYAVNATNNSAASWLYINFSYSDSDWQAAGVNESTLRVWKHNASGWTNATFYSSNGVNTTANIVYANITNFASIFAPAGAADIISACSNLTSAGKTYVLNQSIAINGSGCIQVQADNITLDCRGYSIIGNDTGGTRGIEVSGQTNVTIRNCIVSDFGNGIYLSAMYGNVTNNTAISSGTGIYVAYSINSSITNNTVMSNGWGFVVSGTSGSMFAGNNATSNSVGIGLYSNSVRNILVGNTLHSNHYGMYLSNSSNNSFLNT
ncbi:MAG: NosD domain-containing protein, partial [Candidatus Aenigmatarchaeota archaeon]